MKIMSQFSCLLYVVIIQCFSATNGFAQPLRVGIAGLTHDHVHGILRQLDRVDFKVVGIAEPNEALAEKYSQQYHFSRDLIFASLADLIQAKSPTAVLGFGSTYDHLEIVKQCAPRGIHVMVEKPLAVSLVHAKEMQQLAVENAIHLLVNYETTWYPSNHYAWQTLNSGQISEARKIVVHDGHQGPREIGCSEEFLEWLTDPVQNGGGALTDFGCYGANLITWLMNGLKPMEVTAITQTNKPDIYPKVDDEATILLRYPTTQGIIQASWNWPFNRKDMELYGKTGFVIAENAKDIRVRLKGDSKVRQDSLASRKAPFDDPFRYFIAVVRGDIDMPAYALSSLENNIIVTEILDAARRSAQMGKTIRIN